MYSRPHRNQSLDHSGNNGIGTFDSHESSSFTSSSSTNTNTTTTTTTTTMTTPTIQPNKGSKRYSMNEVFQVWYDNKDQILNPTTEFPVKSSESYRLSKPSQIYHLDLQPSSFNLSHQVVVGDKEQINQSLEKLSLEDYPEQPNSNQHVSGGVPAPAPPPGISENVLSRDQASTTTNSPLVTSDRIEWYYIDPLGTEQGPFNGYMMQEWLTGGYLTLDLKIRRKEESNFKTLKDLCDSVQNYIQPFKIPLPDLNYVAPTKADQRPSPIETGSTPTFQFFQNQLPENSHLSNQQQSQFHHHFLPETNLGPVTGGVRLPGLSTGAQSSLFGNDWKKDPFSSPITTPSTTTSFPATNVSHHVQHHHFGIETFNHHPIGGFGSTHPLQHSTMPSLLQPQIQQPLTATTGWGLDTNNSILTSSNPSTPVNPVMVTSQAAQVNQPTPISPWVSSNVQSSSRVSSPFAPSSSLNSSNSKGPSPLLDTNKDTTGEDTVLDEIHNVVTGILDEEEPKEEKKVEHEHEQEPEPEQEQEQESEKEPQAQPGPEVAHEKLEQELESEQEEVSQDSEEDSGVQLKPAVPQELAPWASKPQEISKPTLTLKEIQRLEAEKLEKQKKLEAQIRNEQAAKAWSSLDTEPSFEKTVPAFPATWASGNVSSTAPTKTLAEIHHEQAEAAARAKEVAATTTISKPSVTNKSTLASTLANAIPKDDGLAWTTVTSKKQPVAKKSITPVITNSVSKTNPQLLRAVSATKPTTPSINVNAIREDFLVWARSNMSNLYPSVTKDDLLDIFITLPSNSTDSIQLISETIYSSSATMDGRRFAQEFMKRRQKVDQTIGYAEAHDQVAWASAVASSADKVQIVDEDGWSTGKTKKRSKKH